VTQRIADLTGPRDGADNTREATHRSTSHPRDECTVCARYHPCIRRAVSGGSGLAVTFRGRTPYPQASWALFRGTKHSSHERRSTSHVFAGGAPGARTLNPRIKRGLLRRSERPACTNVPGICPESTRCTGMRLELVPRAVPRHPRQTRPPRLLNVTTRRRRRLGPWFLFHHPMTV
jgi:hypothetical protein